jgi:hypothetical protein
LVGVGLAASQFGAGWSEFFATQQRNDTVPKRKAMAPAAWIVSGSAGSA